jgi:hypothetical protein
VEVERMKMSKLLCIAIMIVSFMIVISPGISGYGTWDEQPVPKGVSTSPNMFWIVDGNQRVSQKTVSQGARVELEMNPVKSGNLVMYETVNGGPRISYQMGYVDGGYSYQYFFIADRLGNHNLWYRVDNGQESPHLTLKVI